MTSEEVPGHPNDDKSDASSPRSVFHASPDTDSTGSSAGRPSPALPSPASSGHGQWRSLVQAWKRKSMRRLATFPPVVLGSSSSGISKRYLDRRLAQLRWEDDDDGGGVTVGHADAGVRKPSWRCFGSAELAAATDGFSSDNLIGKGGHAEVYRGQLPDGELVAVKRLMRKDGEDERVGDFLSELGIIAHINHPNAARLLGFGVEDGLHFVLQLSPHGSLASLLHGSEDTLDWGIRFKVAVGVAEGLLYLHQGCKRRIIHRDIKASNILLGEDYEPQISDFGLAKWLPQQWTHHVVFPIEGTFGYLAPEYFMHGIVDEKTDVFAFGVLLLELITGRRAVDSSRKSLVMWGEVTKYTIRELGRSNKWTSYFLGSYNAQLTYNARQTEGFHLPKIYYPDANKDKMNKAKPLLETRNVKELIDPSLGDSYNCTHVKRMMLTASMCINHVATKRPHMNQVVQILTGEDKTGEVMNREQKPVGVKAILLDTFDLEDYTSSKYLNDLNRHKQLALE